MKRSFFTDPVTVPVTFVHSVIGEDGNPKRVEENLFFRLRREEQGEADAVAKQQLLGDVPVKAIRFMRFCNLMDCAPLGLEDFPLSNSEFQERFKDNLIDIPAGTAVLEIAQSMGVNVDNRPLVERAAEY